MAPKLLSRRPLILIATYLLHPSTTLPVAWLTQIRYETLRWILRRKDAFGFLLSDASFATGNKEMSQREIDMISEIAQMDTASSWKFWATCFTVQCLSEWGVSTSVWYHGCSCKHETDKEKQQCTLKGRRAVDLASGAWMDFINSLIETKLSNKALAAIAKLSNSGDDELVAFASGLMQHFQDCKTMMIFRATQAWSFWQDMPFSILTMCKHLVSTDIEESVSRACAKDLLAEFDSSSSKTSLGAIPWHFFGNPKNREHMLNWIYGTPLAEELEQLLVGYSSSLCVMQRLEARHHLVNQVLSHGRASSPPALMANLRRRLNHDIDHPKFRELLPELLERFAELVPEQWSSRKQLLQLIYGHGLNELHPNTSFEEQQMARHAALADQLGQSTPSKIVAEF